MMVKGAKALEVWCKRATDGYPVSFVLLHIFYYQSHHMAFVAIPTLPKIRLCMHV